MGRKRNELFWRIFKASGLKNPVWFRRIIRQLRSILEEKTCEGG